MPDHETLWLSLCSADGVGPTTANDIRTKLSERELQLEDFFDLSEETWAADFGLNARVARGLAQQKEQIVKTIGLAESLRDRGVRLVPLDSAQYPASLKKSLARTAPPLLYALGNVALLQRSAAAIIGARDAGARGLLLARFLGESLARNGLVIVSGGARGVDNAAHVGALGAGGETIVVLSCGILRYRPSSALGERTDQQSTLFISELVPTMAWETGGAMARNRIVCALASAVVVVEAKESGGTMQAAKTAFAQGKTVFVVEFDEYDAHSAGNPILLRSGGRPLKAQPDASGEFWEVDIAPILAGIEEGALQEPNAKQMDLFSEEH